MKKIVIVLFLLQLLPRMCLAGFGAVQPAGYNFRSTSVYNTDASASDPAYSHSARAISAANYHSLNSEGGACYHAPAAGPRRISRDDMENEYGTGQIVWQSPVGETPWLFMLLLTAAYALEQAQKGRLDEKIKKYDGLFGHVKKK